MPFKVRPMVEEDHAAVVALINAQADEPTTLEEYRSRLAMMPEDHRILRLVGESTDGRVVGYAAGTTGSSLPPGMANLMVRVDQEYGRQGLGQQLLTAVEEWAAEQGLTRLAASVLERQPEALPWAEQRGYRRMHHLYQSRLELSSFDPAPYLGPLERAQADGFRFASMAELALGEAGYRRFFEFILDTHRDVPGDEDVPSPTYELAQQWLFQQPQFDPAAVWIALDGERWAALAHMTWRRDGGLYNQFTAVRREYRGRGLAQAVKMAGLLWAKEREVASLTTHNHSNNERMLAVNRKMGYVPEPGVFRLEKEI